MLARYGAHIGRSVCGNCSDNPKTLLISQRGFEIQLRILPPREALLKFIQGVVDYIGLLQMPVLVVETKIAYTARLDQHNADPT